MTPEEYNYSVFVMDREMPVIEAFPEVPIPLGSRAPSFPLEDLDTGATVEMSELWRDSLVLIEFGSFT